MSLDGVDTRARNEAWPLLSRFRRYGGPHAHVMGVALLAVVVGSVLGASVPFVIGVAIDAVFEAEPYHLPLVPQSWIPTDQTGQLWFTVVLLGLVVTARAIAGFLNNYLRGVFAQHVKHDLRVDTYEAVQGLEMAFFDGQQTGEIVSILNNDVDQLRTFFNDGLAHTTDQVTTVLAIAVFMTLLNWQLTLVAFAFAPLFAIAVYWFGERIEGIQLEVRRAVGALNSRLQDNVSGMQVIKANTTEPFESGRVEDASGENFRTNWEALKVRTGFYPVVGLLSNATYLATFVIGGYWLLQGPPGPLTGTLTAGQLVPFLLYADDLTGMFAGVAHRIDMYKSARASAIRIDEIERTDLTIEDAADAHTLESVTGRVEYDDVTFGYDANDPVLEHVDFDAKAGQTIGLVGHTGAGKSTLVKLLFRFYDVDSGSIRIDSTDVREVTLRSLRESIGYVSQEPFLFYGTVRENIAYGLSEVTDEEIVDAARVANAHEFVEAFPEGYETMVGERGATLSGGQRQRIALARAFAHDPDILVLDEATSHVDNETEVLIQHSLETITAERTTFVIAHRLSTVRNADQILVFEDGRIVERGTHEDLLEADGRYAALWGVQVGQITALSEEFTG